MSGTQIHELIAGIAGPFAPTERTALLERMGDALVHRGPDDSGTFVGEGIGLVSRRLSLSTFVTSASSLTDPFARRGATNASSLRSISVKPSRP